MVTTTTETVRARGESLSLPAVRVLETIERVRAATVHTLLAHHWTEAPERRTARAGYLILAKLKAQGLVRSRRLEPERGAVSREVLYLWEEDRDGGAGERPRIHDLSERQLDALLQTAEVLLVRERQGWRVVASSETAVLFRQAALNAWHTGALTDAERAFVTLLEHRPELPVPGRLLVRGAGSSLEARVVLPVWTRADAERIAEGLPLHRVRALDIELVACDPALAADALGVLQEATNQAGRPITVWQVAPFRDRPNPALSPAPIPSCEVRLVPAARPATPVALPGRAAALTAGLPLFTGEPSSPPILSRAPQRLVMEGHT